MLGGFRVSVGFRSIEGGQWRLKKAASLVKLLALAADHRMHREQVMDLLWPGLELSKAASNVNYTLHHARRTLEPSAERAPRYLGPRSEQLVLCPQGELWVDIEAFEEAADEARRSREPEAYKVALDLYAGELLPEDRYKEWAEVRREQLRRTYRALLVELAALYEEREEYETATEALGEVLREEPTHEGAHVGLMRLYAFSGQRQEALR
ncbi:MAG: transcriptional regulator, partial [Actinobacteria bacterium]|nr:transcriptional regulator [Actinomycetota bacterium]MCA1739850.1 transcriptional regulator [Actinomycetota bacterium]